MSIWCLFVLSFFPLDILDEILDLIESVSGGFLTYSCTTLYENYCACLIVNIYVSNFTYLNSDISNQKTYRIKMRIRINPPSLVRLLYSSLASASVFMGVHYIFGRKLLEL